MESPMTITPLWSDESQLIGYGESDSGGPWIKLRVPDLDAFRGRKGDVIHATLIPITEIEQKIEPSIERREAYREKSVAERLHLNGYFYNRKLWTAMDDKGIYTQALHKTYIESLPCCRPVDTACNGDIIGHHCRTAENSGVGLKPDDWYLLPVCHAHHDWAHGKDITRERNTELIQAAIELTAQQMKRQMKAWLGIESLSGITQEQVDEFEQEVLYAEDGSRVE